jgi:hypothetical protein
MVSSKIHIISKREGLNPINENENSRSLSFISFMKWK